MRVSGADFNCERVGSQNLQPTRLWIIGLANSQAKVSNTPWSMSPANFTITTAKQNQNAQFSSVPWMAWECSAFPSGLPPAPAWLCGRHRRLRLSDGRARPGATAWAGFGRSEFWLSAFRLDLWNRLVVDPTGRRRMRWRPVSGWLGSKTAHGNFQLVSPEKVIKVCGRAFPVHVRTRTCIRETLVAHQASPNHIALNSDHLTQHPK